MIYSKYCRDLLVGAALRGGTITFPATYYLAMLTGKPGLTDDSYTEIGNVTPNGYARKSIANASAQWSANTSSNAVSYNLNAILFDDPSGGHWVHGSETNPSKIKYIGFFDSATIGAGNLWFYLPLGAEKTVAQSEFDPTIPAGALSLTFDR